MTDKSEKQDLRHKYLFGRIKDFLAVGDTAISDKLTMHMENVVFAEGSKEFVYSSVLVSSCSCILMEDGLYLNRLLI